MVTQQYKDLLKRLRSQMGEPHSEAASVRFELPPPEIQWLGNKTIFRNFSEYPRLLSRPPERVLKFLATELATAASLDGDRGIFIGRRDKQSFTVLLNRYMNESVICPVCGSPDTRLEKSKRLFFLVCEACGARSSVKGG